MTESKTSKKEEYAKAVCMFLGEMLRTRKINLKRSAEIAQKVVENINLIDDEEDFLKLIKELTIDFEEIHKLEKIVIGDVKRSQRLMMEETVREYVISIMAGDPKLALDILVEAIKEETKMEDLYKKFPKFGEFAG